MTPPLTSGGLKPNLDPETQELRSYSLPLYLFDTTKGATEPEMAFIKNLKAILKACKSHLKDPRIKNELNKWNMDPLVDEMTIMYQKSVKGVPQLGTAPSIYPKVMSKFGGGPEDFVTGFYRFRDSREEEIAPIREMCMVVADLIVESIYVGAKPSIQLKIADVFVIRQYGSKIRTMFLENLDQVTRDVIEKFSSLTTAQEEEEAFDGEESYTDDLLTGACASPRLPVTACTPR